MLGREEKENEGYIVENMENVESGEKAETQIQGGEE